MNHLLNIKNVPSIIWIYNENTHKTSTDKRKHSINKYNSPRYNKYNSPRHNKYNLTHGKHGKNNDEDNYQTNNVSNTNKIENILENSVENNLRFFKCKYINDKANNLLYDRPLSATRRKSLTIDRLPLNNINSVIDVFQKIKESIEKELLSKTNISQSTTFNDVRTNKIYKVKGVLLTKPDLYLKILAIGDNIVMIFESLNKVGDDKKITGNILKYIINSKIGFGIIKIKKDGKIIFSNRSFDLLWGSINKKKLLKDKVHDNIRSGNQCLIKISDDIFNDNYLVSAHIFEKNNDKEMENDIDQNDIKIEKMNNKSIFLIIILNVNNCIMKGSPRNDVNKEMINLITSSGLVRSVGSPINNITGQRRTRSIRKGRNGSITKNSEQRVIIMENNNRLSRTNESPIISSNYKKSGSSENTNNKTSLFSDENRKIIHDKIKLQLNSINGMIDLFLDANGRKMSQDDRDYFNTMRESSDNISDIIDNYGNIVNIVEGSIHVEEVPFNIRSILKKCGHHVKYSKESSVLFKIDYDVLPFLMGDARKLEYIIKSLLSFLIKYTNDDNIFIKVHKSSLSYKNQYRLIFDFSKTSIPKKYSKTVDDILKIFSTKFETLNDIMIDNDKKRRNHNKNNNSKTGFELGNTGEYDLIISKHYCGLLGGDIYHKLNHKIINGTSKKQIRRVKTQIDGKNHGINDGKNDEDNDINKRISDIDLNFSAIFTKYQYDFDYFIDQYKKIFNGKRILILNDDRSDVGVSKITQHLDSFGIKSIICPQEKKAKKYLKRYNFDAYIVNLSIHKIYEKDELEIFDLKIPIIGLILEEDNITKKIMKFKKEKYENSTLFDFLYNPVNEVKLFNILIDTFSDVNNSESSEDNTSNKKENEKKNDKNINNKENNGVNINGNDDKYKKMDLLIIGSANTNQKLIVKLSKQIGCHVNVLLSVKSTINVNRITKNHNVILIDVTKLDKNMINLIQKIGDAKRFKGSRPKIKKIFVVGMGNKGILNDKQKRKLYNIGIDVIIEIPVEVDKLRSLFGLIADELNK